MPKVKTKKSRDERQYVSFRMDKDNHALLKIAATVEETSMEDFVNRCVLPKLARYRPIQETILARKAAAAAS